MFAASLLLKATRYVNMVSSILILSRNTTYSEKTDGLALTILKPQAYNVPL